MRDNCDNSIMSDINHMTTRQTFPPTPSTLPASPGRFPVYIGDDAIPELLAFLKARAWQRIALVADENTYPALGARVAQALKQTGLDVNTLQAHGKRGDAVVANEETLIAVISQARPSEQVYLAVGSGTITDVTRFSSFVAKTPFISLPTAPSVDGFTSLGAPLVLGGLKKTLICQAPSAVFADLPTLCAAPQQMLAAGFGDLIGKLNSATDWQLGHVLYGEDYDDAITRRYFATALGCAEYAPGIGRRETRAVRMLMESLIESGFGMLDFGNSNPASGCEHHISHFWEMKLLTSGRRARLHGAKVGVASVITAGWFHRLATLTQDDVATRLKQTRQLDAASQVAAIRAAYGPLSEQLIHEQAEFIEMSPARYAELAQRIVDRWDEVRAILKAMPTSEQMAKALQLAGGPTQPDQLGLTPSDVSEAMASAHYLRKRFTVAKLNQLFLRVF